MNKACIKCSLEKPLGEFYPRPNNIDGRTGKCKVCTKLAVKTNRLNNKDYYLEFDRARSGLEPRLELRRKSLRRQLESVSGREKIAQSKNKWAKNNTQKRRAHYRVQDSITTGKLIPKPCEKCGETEKIHAHHEDYSKPLDVMWLCFKCHKQRHREINAERRSMEFTP